MDVRLTNKSSGMVIGIISKEDFQFLVDNLEEESSRDNDYFIDWATVDFLADAGGTVALLLLLRAAVGSSDGIEIAWEEI